MICKVRVVYEDGGVAELVPALKRKDRGMAVTVPKLSDYSKVSYIDIFFDDMSSKVGEDGYILISARHNVNNPIEDYGLCYYKEREDEQLVSGPLRCPVIGVKKKDKALLCVATGMATNISQVITVKNGIYSTDMRFMIAGETPYEEISVFVYELEGENATYSGMARAYRDYQLSYGGFQTMNERMNPELEYGAKSVLVRVRHGWKPVPTTVPEQTPENEPPMHVACTFRQVEKLVEAYYENGIRNAEFCLVGWNIKGHDGRWPQFFPVEEALGGEEDLRHLIARTQELGFQIVCHCNFSDCFTIAENFRLEDMLVTRRGNRPTSTIWAGGRSYSPCPMKALENAKEQLPKVAELGFRGLNYIDVVTNVLPQPCYHPDHPVNAKESTACYEQIFELSRSLFGGTSSEGPNAFVQNKSDYCLYVSFARNPEEKWEFFDKEVPFWQIAHHGIVLYNSYTRTVNSAMSCDKSNMLKSFECGDRPTVYYYSKFKYDGNNWMGDKDFCCGTEEEIAEGIAALKPQYDMFMELSYLQTVFIQNHREIADGIFETEYEDGSVSTADYNTLTFVLNNKNGRKEWKLS